MTESSSFLVRQPLYFCIYLYYSNTIFPLAFLFSDGGVIEDLACNCFYNKEYRTIGFWCGERERLLKVIKILKDSNNIFEFIDENGFKVKLYPVAIQGYIHYRESSFINAPTLNTDEGIQGRLLQNK